jgi:hypothetical protein
MFHGKTLISNLGNSCCIHFHTHCHERLKSWVVKSHSQKCLSSSRFVLHTWMWIKHRNTNGWHKIYQIGGGFGTMFFTTNVYEEGYTRDPMH